MKLSYTVNEEKTHAILTYSVDEPTGKPIQWKNQSWYAQRGAMNAITAHATKYYAVLEEGLHMKDDFDVLAALPMQQDVGYVHASFEGVYITDGGRKIVIPTPLQGWGRLQVVGGVFLLQSSVVPSYTKTKTKWVEKDGWNTRAFWLHSALDVIVRGHPIVVSLFERGMNYWEEAKKEVMEVAEDNPEKAGEMVTERIGGYYKGQTIARSIEHSKKGDKPEGNVFFKVEGKEEKVSAEEVLAMGTTIAVLWHGMVVTRGLENSLKTLSTLQGETYTLRITTE